MKDNKKDIERLFQEKFKDFEAMPPSDSWKNIEARLNEKKKKRRVIPFWFKTTGIAATLILGVFLFMNKKDNLNSTNNEVVIENNAVSTTQNNSNNVSSANEVLNKELLEENNVINASSEKSNVFANEKENLVVQEKSNHNELNKNLIEKNKTENNGIKKIKDVTIFNSKKQVIVSNSEKALNKKNTKTSDLKKNASVYQANENVVAATNSEKEKLKSAVETKGIKNSNNLKEDFIVNVNNNEKPSESNLNLSKNNFKDKEQNLIVNVTSRQTENKNNLQANTYTIQNTNKKINETVIANALETKKLDSIILVQNSTIANAIQDSALVAEVNTEENPLEKLLKEKLEGKNVDEKEEEKRNKWAASTYASPVYFNSAKQGSPIDDQFIESSKGYNATLSYGLGLEYAVSKKISIKTGVNTLAFNYTTNDVFYTTTLQSVTQNVATITRNNNGENLALANRNRMIDEADVENFVQNNQGSLNQEMGYIEVPLELSYKIMDQKFGINIIGGMSTLFLNTNSVSLLSNQAETNIGRANNLNNIHFSSNVGLGFKYAFWKSFQANFQPMFKYQINTFSRDSGNFKPYFGGLYSGISFSF